MLNSECRVNMESQKAHIGLAWDYAGLTKQAHVCITAGNMYLEVGLICQSWSTSHLSAKCQGRAGVILSHRARCDSELSLNQCYCLAHASVVTFDCRHRTEGIIYIYDYMNELSQTAAL